MTFKQYNITDVTACPSIGGIRGAAMVFCVIGLVLFPSLVFAKDASASFSNSPGFRCNRWNGAGECADWSYYDYYYKHTPVYRGAMQYKRNTYVVPVRGAPSKFSRGLRSICSNPTADCTGRVTARVRATPNPVTIGGRLAYTVYVRNDDSQIRTVNVRAYLDENVELDNVTYGGYLDGDLIRWDALRIPALSSRSLTLNVVVRSSAPTGTPVRLTVRADNSIDTSSVKVLDEGYYSNAIRVLDDGIYVYYNHYTGTRLLRSQPVYYHDQFGNVRVR